MHWASGVYDLKLRLPLINCPTLVLIGTKDPFYGGAGAVNKLVSNSKFVIIGNGPIHVDRIMPEEFAAAILSFLFQ